MLTIPDFERVFGLQGYLNDDLQGFDLLVSGPGLLQGLVQLLDAVGVVLLGEVKQLSLRTLHTQKVKSARQIRNY